MIKIYGLVVLLVMLSPIKAMHKKSANPEEEATRRAQFLRQLLGLRPEHVLTIHISNSAQCANKTDLVVTDKGYIPYDGKRPQEPL